MGLGRKREIIFDYWKPASKFFSKHLEIRDKFEGNMIQKITVGKVFDIVKMEGYEDLFRMRIGKYRIIYRISEIDIVVVEVEDAGARGGIYKK